MDGLRDRKPRSLDKFVDCIDRLLASWNPTSREFTARKARPPGRKLTIIAASGVWPLFVLPKVDLIRSNLLRLAMTKSVRLET